MRYPTDSQTLGPQQVQTRFRSSVEVSRELNLLQAAETELRFGNLLTLPTGERHGDPRRAGLRRANRPGRILPAAEPAPGALRRPGRLRPSLAEALDDAVGSGTGAPVDQAQHPSTLPPGSGEQAGPELRVAVSDTAAAAAAAGSPGLRRLYRGG